MRLTKKKTPEKRKKNSNKKLYHSPHTSHLRRRGLLPGPRRLPGHPLPTLGALCRRLRPRDGPPHLRRLPRPHVSPVPAEDAGDAHCLRLLRQAFRDLLRGLPVHAVRGEREGGERGEGGGQGEAGGESGGGGGSGSGGEQQRRWQRKRKRKRTAAGLWLGVPSLPRPLQLLLPPGPPRLGPDGLAVPARAGRGLRLGGALSGADERGRGCRRAPGAEAGQEARRRGRKREYCCCSSFDEARLCRRGAPPGPARDDHGGPRRQAQGQ